MSREQVKRTFFRHRASKVLSWLRREFVASVTVVGELVPFPYQTQREHDVTPSEVPGSEGGDTSNAERR